MNVTYNSKLNIHEQSFTGTQPIYVLQVPASVPSAGELGQSLYGHKAENIYCLVLCRKSLLTPGAEAYGGNHTAE